MTDLAQFALSVLKHLFSGGRDGTLAVESVAESWSVPAGVTVAGINCVQRVTRKQAAARYARRPRFHAAPATPPMPHGLDRAVVFRT